MVPLSPRSGTPFGQLGRRARLTSSGRDRPLTHPEKKIVEDDQILDARQHGWGYSVPDAVSDSGLNSGVGGRFNEKRKTTL